MNRTDRLLAIVLELQRKKRGYYRAKDLAKTFEVSQRTIYRDMLALREAGVPISVADREGYALVEGYFLPPLSFSSDEALILILGSEFIAKNFDQEFRSAAHSAYRKIDAVLEDSLRKQVDALKSKFQILSTRPLSNDVFERLRQLRGAIADRQRVSLLYSKQDLESNKIIRTAREVDPYSLTRLSEDWYLTGYCHLRQSVRMFRLSRIERLEILKITFEYPEEETNWLDEVSDQPPLFVQALFNQNIVPRVRKSTQYSILEEEKTPEGIKITFMAQAQPDVVRWFLGYGGDVRVLEPDWLQVVLIQHAKRVLKTYGQNLEND